MTEDQDLLAEIEQSLEGMAHAIEHQKDVPILYYDYFIAHPTYASQLVERLGALSDDSPDTAPAFFSACLLAFEICISNLKSSADNNHYGHYKLIQQLMLRLAHHMYQKKQGVLFWLPVLNAFYEENVILSPVLQNAYLSLIEMEEDRHPLSEEDELSALHEMISDLSDLSIYEIADHFFAQSYAMPPDFFADLLFDLSTFDTGQSICILALLHPDPAVRGVVIDSLDQLMTQWVLTPQQLFWLRSIQLLGHSHAEPYLSRWIRLQRMKGVVFQAQKPQAKVLWIRASEIDVGGAQGLFIALKEKTKYRLCGLLLKYEYGLKEVWLTPVVEKNEFLSYCNDIFDDGIQIKAIEKDYLMNMVNHFLSMMDKKNQLPTLHLLELEEVLGDLFRSKPLNLDHYFDDLSIQIHPFTEEVLQKSFARSKRWIAQERHTQSWYVESPTIDKVVNRYCHFQGDVKVCEVKEAAKALMSEVFEYNRDHWIFYFFWLALWLKSSLPLRATVWQDAFLLAYAIKSGYALKDIPIMHRIADETVLNSLDTMEKRQTHLSLS